MFDVGMASSLGKRIKTIGSKRKDKEPERSYSNKFLSHKHERHFNIVQDRRLLMERKVGLILHFATRFGEHLENRNLERLATYPTPTNIAVVKEFYTNARQLGMEEGADFVDVKSVLCVPGGHFQRNRNGVVVNIRRVDLTPLAKGMSINIGHVIANEIQVYANTMNNKAPLGHPSLITHLWELARVNISTLPLERPRKEIDEAYYRQYCGRDEAAQPMRDMYMSSMEDRLQSIHKGQLATTKMIIGMYDTPPGHLGGPWMNSIMWWHGQRIKHMPVELEQLKLQLWIMMRMKRMTLKMLKKKERRKIRMIAWVDEELR
ncbi:hypothetical protein LR48_Vigan07g112400 [Vigna angularis]|uniref:Putative plant transposon protein domain-containing protein n=1 Tax=Phaseolus angularis TaxID=3914 RepID=A0A0L9UX40_PHAAN|nr:hypothetical protein LR48_Vigan07g112400 [Vigna angularis]